MAEHILASLAQIITGLIKDMGYFGITILMALESACIPVPSELVMPFAGYMVSAGAFGFWQIVLWGTIGQTIGSIITFWIGATGGRSLLEKYGKYLLIRTDHIHHADRWFERYGHKVVFFGRLVPIIRTFISLPAGMSKMSFAKFVLYSVIGIIPWTAMLAYLGFYLGENWYILKTYFHGADVIIAVAIVGCIAYILYNKARK
ncbi:MAG: DedA family protein [Actinomycetota bacterium]|nr:DedA family protein [Actinomycetota bacterium]